MDIRNARYNAQGGIDCDINHWQFGWIRFSADADDPEYFGREVYAAALASGPAPYISPEPILPTVEEVRAEAQRRMMALLGARDPAHLDILISNGQREQGRLEAIRNGIPGVIDPRAWTEAEIARAAILWQADQAIEAIRAASNALEAVEPIPADFTDDTHWP